MDNAEGQHRSAFAAIDGGELEAIVAANEVAGVEFKRSLPLDAPAEKVAFICALAALANSAAGARRLLLIGLEGRRGEYHAPPDPRLNQNRLEQLVTQYVEPPIKLSYSVVTYRSGPVGVIEVARDAARLPYRIRKTIRGETRRERGMVVGDIYVQHGVRTELATPAEAEALRHEGDRARAAV